MRFTTRFVIGVALLATRLSFGQASQDVLPNIPRGDLRVDLRPVASGLTSPTYLTPALDGSGRMFVVDQIGKVRILSGGVLQPTPFLDLSSQIVTLQPGYDERGLLGMAFDPNFNDSTSAGYHRVFTYQSQPVSGAADFTVPAGTATAPMDNQGVITSWKVSATNPNVIDMSTRREIVRFDHPESNHNGGTLAFGPDHNLYIGIGDGGNANDTGNGHNPTIGNAQDLTTVMGKLLRLDVYGNNSANGRYGIPTDNPYVHGGGLAEIYASGLRNPFRFSFDRGNGQLIVADVGQNTVEEIDRVVNGGNYGWPYKEGTFRFNRADGTVSTNLAGLPANLIDPIAEYDHGDGTAIIGGFVYRGTLLPALVGKYIFGDLSNGFASPNGRLLYADLTTGQISEFHLGANDLPLGRYIKGFGQDDAGELYVLTSTTIGPSGTTGEIFQLVPEPGAFLLLTGALPLLIGRRRNEVGKGN